MRKLMLSVIILTVLVVSIGCQPSGLSEEEVRGIVREEVTRQLATVDTLTVSELYIKNKDGKVAGMLYTDADGHGRLRFQNPDGTTIALLGSGKDSHGLLNLVNSHGECVVIMTSLEDNGSLFIFDKYGELTFRAPVE